MEVILFLIFLIIIIVLLISRSDSSQKRRQEAADRPEELRNLQAELRSLRESITVIHSRLTILEQNQGKPSVSEGQAAKEAPAIAAIPSQESVPIVERWESPIAQSPPSGPGEVKPAEAKEQEWEQILGGNWLARIGAIALVIGVGFFLKFAFDNNWIGPTGQIVLGIVIGLALLGGGYFWQKRYPILSQAISGAGIAILYLSVFAAFAIYNLMPLYPTLAFLLLISIASATLALLYNSMSLAIIGILGAFIAPSILAVPTPTIPAAGPAGHNFWLLVYAMVVDIGVLALSSFRNWRWFTLLALLGSLAIYGSWYGEFGYKAGLPVSLAGLTLIFLIFVGATTIFHVIWRRPPQEFDQALMVANAAAYFGISYGLLWQDYRAWLGAFSLLMAIFYGCLAYIILKRSVQNVALSLFAVAIALVFLTVAVPVQLGNRAWTTIAWAAEGTALVWLSFPLRMPRLRDYSYVVFSIMAVRLLFFDQLVNVRTFRPILNERFLAFLVSILALYLAGYLMRRRQGALRDGEKGAWSVYPILFVAANFFTVWILSDEVIYYFDTSLALTALWTIYAVILLVVGIFRRWRTVRLFALALLAIPIIKVFIYDVFTLRQLYRIIAFVGLGIILLASAYLYQRYSSSIRGFIVKK